MHARHRRVRLLERQLGEAEMDRDRSVAAFVQYGRDNPSVRHETSQRAVGRQLGLSHTAVGDMIERADLSPGPKSPQIVPVLTADRARAYVESGALGDVARVTVAYNPADIVLESGLDPAALVGDSDVPTMLIHGIDGDVIGVEECLAGYGGTGPSNTHRLLTQLGWADSLAREVFTHRFIELDSERVIRASEDSVHTIGGGLALAPDGHHLIARLRSHRPFTGDGHTIYDSITAWCNEVLDQPDRYPWAAGVRRARVYLDREAAAALQEEHHVWRGANHFSVVIEQGRLQLWVSAIYPYNFADLLSTEQLRVLDAAGLRPEGAEPRTWLDRFLPHRRERPPYLTISDDNEDLAYDPEN